MEGPCPFVNLILRNKDLSFEDIKYNFDFSNQEHLELYNKIYKGKYIKDFDKFKDEYSSFFYINRTHSTSIFFKFYLGRFCDTYGISNQNLLNMIENNENYLPIPITGEIKLKKGNEIILCNFTIYLLYLSMVPICFPKNDVYMIKYESIRLCELKLIEDLSREEKIKYEDFLSNIGK